MTAVALVLAALLAAAGAARAELPAPGEPGKAAPAPAGTPAGWPAFRQRYIEDYFQTHPGLAAYEGRHEFDGRLPDWSRAGIDAEIHRLEAWRSAAAGWTDASLDATQAFERDYLLAQTDNELFWMRDLRWPLRNPAYYSNALDPSMYLSRPYGTPELRLRGFVGYLRAVPRACAEIRANLQPPLPRAWLDLGVNAFSEYAHFFRGDAQSAFAGVGDARLQGDLVAAAGAAADAMQGLSAALESGRPQADEGYVLGAAAFQRMLWMTERVDTPLDRLEAIGRADLQRNLEALRHECARYAPDLALTACLAAVNAAKPLGGAVEGARTQLDGLRRFVVEHRLVSIPGDEIPLVAEAPPYQRWNFAYIETPGPFETGMPGIYRIAPADPTWPEAERDAYTPGKDVLLFVSAHEVWPGHFLHFLHANRSSVEFGRVFQSYAFTEGWAHYSEEMMWDAGLGEGSASVHIGQLQQALLRDVRFACAIGMHTRGMSQTQCETLFREQAFLDPGNARQQAARGTFDPAYLNYTLGKLMIRNLRREWIESHPQPQALRVFHDTLLSFGAPPIPLVRARMLDRKTPGDLFGQ